MPEQKVKSFSRIPYLFLTDLSMAWYQFSMYIKIHVDQLSTVLFDFQTSTYAFKLQSSTNSYLL